MSREQPKNPPPPITKWSDEKQGRTIGGTQVVIQERPYRLITPLFGGGVEPGVNDPDNLIRATEIRGQLRFWWRAMRGGQFGGNLARMKEREDEIWGAASKTEHSQETGEEQDKKAQWKEPVQLEINVSQIGQPVKPFKIVPKTSGRGYKAVSDNDIPDYAAFPLRPKDDDIKKMETAIPLATLQQNVEFILTITFPTRWAEEVEAALWAWETFGGVGARTRRGFGVLLPKKRDGKDIEEDQLPPGEAHAAKEWIQAKIRSYSGGQQGRFPANVPHVDDETNMRIIGSPTRPISIWKQLIDALRKFRQPRVDAKSGRPSDYGKSLWPEAGALRKRLRTNDDNSSDKFPRAAFGLPIVFHLAHEHPATTITLQGDKQGAERWASRLILKPIPCRGGQCLGLALVLDGSELPEIELALLKDDTDSWKKITKKQTEIKAGELPRLREWLGIGNETDILLAFLNYLEKEETHQ
jgi:CRISPR-associated protein Cmr1